MARLNKKKILRNFICVVLDASDSMTQIKRATVQAYNALTEKFRNPPDGQQNYVSFLTFSTHVHAPRFINARPEFLEPLNDYDYRTEGYTALLDAVGFATEQLDEVKTGVTFDDSFVLLVITDGQENHSVRYNQQQLQSLFRQHQQRGNWTFTFQVPKGQKTPFCCKFGIPEDNVQEWEQTDEGTRETFSDTQDAMGNFYAGRTSGQRATKNFFQKVTSKVPSNAKRLLTDLSKSFREFKVITEDIIRPFVETKTGEEYVRGNAFYQLMKPEKVQPTKEVLVKEKGKKSVYGGPEARGLIGLPAGQYAQVDPGNHGNYDVFVQSRSVNRILPRGTKVLVRV